MFYLEKKQLNVHKIYNAFSRKVERFFYPGFYCLLVSLIFFRVGGMWIVGSPVDAQSDLSVAADCWWLFNWINVNSVNILDLRRLRSDLLNTKFGSQNQLFCD